MGWLRTVVIWLLVLALPVQGAAAATMALCKLNHQGMPAAVQRAGHVQADPGRPASEPCHGAVHQQHPTSPAQAHASADTPSGSVATPIDVPALKLAHADQHNCSACAACSSAAAFSSAVVEVPAPAVCRTANSAPVPAVERFATDGPDRPPRPLLV